MTEPNYKQVALRAFALAKWADDSDFALHDEYVRELDAIAKELGVSDCKAPEELGIPWPPTWPISTAIEHSPSSAGGSH